MSKTQRMQRPVPGALSAAGKAARRESSQGIDPAPKNQPLHAAAPPISWLTRAKEVALGTRFPKVTGGADPYLFGTVFAAVHHAEVIAERIGEPYGTLLLTLAVTIIEVALIATIMLGEKPQPALARDTVFAVVMIVCNGLVGLCIFIGGLRYREQDFQVSGANLYLSVLFVLATIMTSP